MWEVPASIFCCSFKKPRPEPTSTQIPTSFASMTAAFKPALAASSPSSFILVSWCSAWAVSSNAFASDAFSPAAADSSNTEARSSLACTGGGGRGRENNEDRRRKKKAEVVPRSAGTCGGGSAGGRVWPSGLLACLSKAGGLRVTSCYGTFQGSLACYAHSQQTVTAQARGLANHDSSGCSGHAFSSPSRKRQGANRTEVALGKNKIGNMSATFLKHKLAQKITSRFDVFG